MTFTTTYLVWLANWEKSCLSGLAFCDWCEENGRDPQYTSSWRNWLTFSGVEAFEGELRRLANAESAAVERGRKRVA